MRLALIQLASTPGEVAANLAAHVRAVEGVAGADLAVFPELSVWGYAPELARPVADAVAERRPLARLRPRPAAAPSGAPDEGPDDPTADVSGGG